jgi:hypothetical protein
MKRETQNPTGRRRELEWEDVWDAREAELLLCLGITAEELAFTKERGPQALVDVLIKGKVFPLHDA